MTMTIFLSIILFLLIFSFVVLLHEFGHFYAAKKSGVKVEEFGLGLPPKLYGKKIGETVYSINAIPFGGFVRLFGEEPSALNKKNPRSFQSQSFLKKVLIVSGGVLMNFLLAWVLLTINGFFGMKPILLSYDDVYQSLSRGEMKVTEGQAPESMKAASFQLSRLRYQAQEAAIFSDVLQNGDIILELNEKPVFTEADLQEALKGTSAYSLKIKREALAEPVLLEDVKVSTQGPLVMALDPKGVAIKGGVKSGDLILAVNGQSVVSGEDFIAILSNTKEPALLLDVLRDGSVLQLELVREASPKIGVELVDAVDPYPDFSFHSVWGLYYVSEWVPQRRGLVQAMGESVDTMLSVSKSTAKMFFSVIAGFIHAEKVPDGVAGPIGMFEMTYRSVLEGSGAVLRFVAMLSLSLGVINILPFPALDGGRLVFIILQACFPSSLLEKLEGRLHYAGFVFLMIFLIYITFNDILRIL